MLGFDIAFLRQIHPEHIEIVGDDQVDFLIRPISASWIDRTHSAISREFLRIVQLAILLRIYSLPSGSSTSRFPRWFGREITPSAYLPAAFRSGSNEIFRRIPVATAMRSSVRVEGLTRPLSSRAITV